MGSAQVKPSKASNRDSPDIKVPLGTSEERETANDDTEDAHNTSKEVDNDDGVSDTSQSDSDTSETGMTLTPEEEKEKYKEELISIFQKSIKKIQTQSSFTKEEEECILYTEKVKAVLSLMHTLFYKLSKETNASLSEIIEWRKRISNIAMETKLMDLVCEIVKTTCPESETLKVRWVLRTAAANLHNYTDASAEFAVAVAAYPGLCEKLKQILEEQLEGHVNKSQTSSMDRLIESVLCVVHNLTMVESNIGRLREVNFLRILTAYLATPHELNRLVVFASLAGIINEKESEIIKANMDLVQFLLNVLSEGMATDQHRHKGWSCKECTLTVRMLARNDANKKLLVQLGALELVVKLGQTGNQEEQFEAVSALWALSFDADNRKRIVSEAELCVVDLLLELKSSEEKNIKKACEGALWTLRDDLKDSSVEKYKSIESYEISAKVEVSQPGKDTGHVMISYQWADQQMLKRIRDQLKAAGIKVWMDIDQMGGSTLESMAKAVEEATVVLICMSQKYKISPNCRAEAEYAFQKRKTIVPLMMERDFEPDGWLGMICGTKLHFKFIPSYPKYKFEDVMPKLLTEIANIYDKEGKQGVAVVIPKQVPTTAMPDTAVDQVDSRPPAAAGNSVTMVTPDGQGLLTSLKSVRDWEAGDVQKWVEKHDLKSCGVDGLAGKEVALLCMMYHRAPESLFQCLQDKSKLKKLLKTSKLVWALDELVEEQ